MARTLFGLGAHGGVVEEIQNALLALGFDPKGADGWYGNNTVAAVKSFQTVQGRPPTGTVDDVTWQALMRKPVPATDARSLQLTAAFEGHGYSLAVGNFDGAWLTWGIIGFTLKHGEVQKIVLNIQQRFPRVVEDAFGDKASELIRIMKSSPKEQERWANSVTVKGRLAEPWRTGFDWLGRFPEVREEQRRAAHANYFLPALNTAKKYGLKSELGLALCFDIQVQNGGVKQAARTLIEKGVAKQKPARERDLRRLIANSVADVARQEYREDVRRRKLTLANGEGDVHGHHYVLQQWGLSDLPAVELA